MADKLPTKRAHWKRAATRNNIHHTQSLTAGPPLVSGSKFTFEHFLRLRVLYIQIPDPKTLAKSASFPKERLEEMKDILEKNTDAAFLKSFLQDQLSLASSWSVDKAKESGMFAVALEHLHLIAKRSIRSMTDSEEIISPKIDLSPRKTRSMAQSSAPYRGRSLSAGVPSTPTRNPRGTYPNSLLNDLNDFSDSLAMSSLKIQSPEEVVSEPDSDLRQAKYDYERSDFTPGDEQTVNAALVALIMVLSWLLGQTGRVHHDRARFRIPKDAKNYLYSAGVDGLIMHLNGDKLNGFMEVKRDLRAGNRSVRRQIAAQMAAFIFEQDFVVAEKEREKEAEREIEKVSKGKGKKAEAKAKEDMTKDKDGGNQKW